MKKLYLVACVLTVDREGAVAKLEKMPGCGPWFYSMPNSFCIFSERRAGELFNLLHNPSDANENLLVTEMPTGNYSGWLPQAHCDLVQRNSIVHRYELDFVGFWTEGRQGAMPAGSGVYCVYACVPQPDTTLSLLRLLYIGRSENIQRRLCAHEKTGLWKSLLRDGEKLCYSYASVPSRSLEVCEAALIFWHRPPCNDQSTSGFYHSTTTVRTKGSNLFLSPEFTVFRSIAE